MNCNVYIRMHKPATMVQEWSSLHMQNHSYEFTMLEVTHVNTLRFLSVSSLLLLSYSPTLNPWGLTSSDWCFSVICQHGP